MCAAPAVGPAAGLAVLKRMCSTACHIESQPGQIGAGKSVMCSPTPRCTNLLSYFGNNFVHLRLPWAEPVVEGCTKVDGNDR